MKSHKICTDAIETAWHIMQISFESLLLIGLIAGTVLLGMYMFKGADGEIGTLSVPANEEALYNVPLSSGKLQTYIMDDNVQDKPVSLGTFKVTAYCGCETCCGKWGKDRPVDAEGNAIVYTAYGDIAREGVTVAADPSVFPHGTEIIIDGRTYTVQDKGGAIKEKCIDIYFESHEDAREWGVKYIEVFGR